MRSGLVIMMLGVAACGASPRPATSDGGGSGSGSGSGSDAGGLPTDPGQVSIFAHTQSSLYSVNPTTLAITKIGDFNFSASFEQMTDLAIDKNGQLIGVTFFSVYKVDPTNANVTLLTSSLASAFNGLSFVPADLVGRTGDDILVGTETTDGKVFNIDPMTGATTQIGDMGSYQSSGDTVAIEGYGILQTVKGSPHDKLARLASTTFAATVIGDTGYDQIWGLGFWGGKIYGFTNTGQFLSIDPTTGAGTLLASNGPAWWGAAVTTVAPVIE